MPGATPYDPAVSVNGLPDVARLFVELAAIASPSGEERPVADAVARYLRDLALDVDEDETGPSIGSSMGNLYCRLPPTDDDGGTPIFLCAHLDTVPPDSSIEPVVGEDGVIRNARATILGADNKSAVAAMLEAARRVLVEGRPHAGIELLFTPKEEVGLCGAEAFDHTRLHANVGYVYDHAGPIGEVILGAPHAASIDATFRGKAAHAGMYPEEGRSAVAAAARAVADLRLGRLDEETTANVGEITRRQRAQRRSRAVQLRGGGALARRREAPRPGARDARDDDVRGEPRRLRRRDAGAGALQRLPLQARGRAGAARQCGAPALRLRAPACPFRRRGGRERLQRARAAVPEPGERDGQHPLVGRAHPVADLEGMVEVTLALVEAARNGTG